MDEKKLRAQHRLFGSSQVGMPPLEVTRGRNREMMINDGVTRATRIWRYDRGATVPVRVIAVRNVDLSGLPRVREQALPEDEG